MRNPLRDRNIYIGELQDRCRAALDVLLESSHGQAFIVFQRALREHYPWIVDSMNQDSCEGYDQVDSTPPRML